MCASQGREEEWLVVVPERSKERLNGYGEKKQAALCSSKEPHIKKQEEDGDEETQPHPPTDAGALSHTKHASHVSTNPNSGAIERVVEVCEVRGIADFVADGKSDLTLSSVTGHTPKIHNGSIRPSTS